MYDQFNESMAKVPYATGQIANAACRPPTLQERLDMAVSNAQQQLKEATEARDIFTRNPDLERLLDIMQKGRF